MIFLNKKFPVNHRRKRLIMYRFIWLFFAVIICSKSYAVVDIDLACEEKKEQQHSLLTKMSTSLTEAHLAGQCTGYKTYDKIDWKRSCSEYIEQKNALLSFLSTSLSEANSAGKCVGAIYKVAQQCDVKISHINYSRVAEGATSLESVKIILDCNGKQNGW